MSGPRILQIGKFYPPHHGGMEAHLELLCRHLRARFDVHVVVSNEGPSAASEVRDGIPVRRLPRPFSITSAPVNTGLASAIRDVRPDLVHLHLPHPGAVLGLLPSGYRGPLVVTYHSDVVRQRLMGAIFQPLLDACLNRASAILVTSRAYLETSAPLRRHRSRCTIIPLGIPLDGIAARTDPRVAAIRTQYGPRIVLAVGRFVYYKGFEVLLDAMREIDAHLLLVGDGPEREALVARGRRLGIEGRVSFLGTVADTSPYFAAADVFVLPSTTRAEAFGIVQLEAMASRTPVVNTRLATGVPWVSEHEKTGLTVTPGNVTELAGAIGRLLGDDGLRERMGEAGRARVERDFTDHLMVSRIIAVYEDVLGSQFARPA